MILLVVMKIVLCSLIFSEAYLKQIKKLIPKIHTVIITDKVYSDYTDTEAFIFIYGNAMNEKGGLVQLRTSTHKTNHYNSTLPKLLEHIDLLEGLMYRLF